MESSRLKFRAWDGERMRTDFFQLCVYDDGCELWLYDEPQDWPVMQFTGLTDTEGVEIYEGDFVEFTYWWFDGNVAESLLSGEVVYCPEFMSYALKGIKNSDWIKHAGDDEAPFAFWRFDGDNFRVIGNIHEHPELQEGDR